MFFRVTRAGRYQYVQIARSYRDGTVVKQQTLLSLGRLDVLQASGQLDALLGAGLRLSEGLVVVDAHAAGQTEALALQKIGPERPAVSLAALRSPPTLGPVVRSCSPPSLVTPGASSLPRSFGGRLCDRVAEWRTRGAANRANRCFFREPEMKKNRGTTDRTIRTLLAALIAVLYFTRHISDTLGTVLLVAAVAFAVTSFVSWCPAYIPLGISTRKNADSTDNG